MEGMWQLQSVMLILQAGALHPLPQNMGWSSEDQDSTKAKARSRVNLW